MLAVFQPLDRAQSKKTFEPSFVKIGWRVHQWKKTKVETLSADWTKNQNSKTVIKTIIDDGHLGKIIDQK
jgi:hypothetical protein